MPTRSKIALLIALAALLLSAGVSVAVAARDQGVLFEAPRDLLNVDDATRARALATLDTLGVKALRVVLYGRDVAPAYAAKRRPSFDATSPGSYNWGRYDPAIQAASQRGWQILLTVSGPVPRWATP